MALGPETPGARLLNNGMANSNKKLWAANPAPNVLPRMEGVPCGLHRKGSRAENQVREQDKDKDILNGGEERVLEKFSYDPWSSLIWFSALEEDPDDSTSHTGSGHRLVLLSSFNPHDTKF